ncbi:MAG: hypothetical protein WCH39_07020 [Schlesneria sp.]
MNLMLAYFDPTAGSLLLQALVGGFGGIMVVGRYLWMQLRGQEQTQVVLSQSQEIPIPSQYRSR